MSTRTFTATEAIDITYDYGQKSTAHDLKHFAELADIKNTKGFTSVWIHSSEYGDLDIHIEAYDDEFYELTSTDKKRDKFKDRVHNTITKLFPHMEINVVWYSGFDHHKYVTLNT